jgi:hypothetical protein
MSRFKAGHPRTIASGSKGGRASAVSRRGSAGPWSGTILDLMDAAGMMGPEWTAWRAFWCAVYALPMSPDELVIYQRHTKRETPPAEPVAEAWMCIGRGGGKTRNSSLNAIYRALVFDSASVDPGEDVVIPLLASDRRQARAALKYIRGFNKLRLVAPYVERGELKETAEYKTGVNIEVVTASKRAPRGYSCPTGCADEIAWWETEDDHSNPDHEILTALRGSLGRVPDALLLALSNPAAPRGELYEAVEHSFGKDDPEVLVWNADTLSMNPTYDRKAIARAFRRDPVVAGSEFGSGGFVVFRQARQALFDDDAVRQVIVTDRFELDPIPGVKYVAFLDAAEGSRSGDSMTLGLAHEDGSRAVLDLLRVTEPPFDPATVLRTYAGVCHDYNVREVHGDRHAVGFVEGVLQESGLKFVPSVLTKSDLFSELLPLVNTGAVELLDHPDLRTQLLTLERRSVRGGRDSIDHPRGGHDDVANAAAGAVVLVTGVGQRDKKKFPLRFSGSTNAHGIDAEWMRRHISVG